jgi:hypothetical protein
MFLKKRMNKVVSIFFMIFGINLCSAQSGFKENHDFGLAFSYAPKEVNVALAWKQVHGVTPNRKFKIGYGIRYNGYLSNDKNYVTAPAYLTSGEKGPQVLFIENIQENIDTFSVHNAQHNSVNAVIFMEYGFTDKWGFGFNIDAAGIAFGGKREGKMISSNRPNTSSEAAVAKPTPYNLLLVSDNDIGMLNSELYATYNWNKKLSVNAGFTFLFTEYKTEQKIEYNDNNDRFRKKSLMGLISINYKPFKN